MTKGGTAVKALITGATSGIGREMAKILAARGVDLIIASRDEQRMRHIAKRLPVAVRTIAVDLSKAEDCYRLYDAVKAEEIDILINNAGFGAYGATWDVPLETELNMLTKLFLADFRKRGSGRILNVASSAGFLAGPLMSGYYATKGYVLRLSEAISEELRQEGSRVTVTALCPGHVETNFDARAKVRRSIGGVSAKRVAQAGIEGMLRGKVVVLPGALMKMAYVGEKLLPESWMLKIAYRAQARKG